MGKIKATTLVFVLALAGCAGGGGTATDMVSATAGLRGLTAASEPPSGADLALNCNQVSDRLANLYSRYGEIEREQRARQRQSELVGGMVNIGATLAGGSALANAGSVSAIRNVGVATRYGTAALTGLAAQESSTQKLQDVNDTMLVAQRITQLEKVKYQKGCP